MRGRFAPTGGAIVPDFAMPQALCAPFWPHPHLVSLKAFLPAAAAHVGVILIAPDPEAATAFVDRSPAPDHFGVVAACPDSAWLRDRGPVFRAGGGAVLPSLPDFGRPRDAALFATILQGDVPRAPLTCAGGNLVAGAGGRVISTDQVLRENGLTVPADLAPLAAAFGIADWLIVPGFADDRSCHADAMVRFLAPDLCAIAARQDDGGVSEAVAAAISAAWPDVTLLRLPCAGGAEGFDSPLNWVQLGRAVFVPGFAGHEAVLGPLCDHGFDAAAMPCNTTGLGGGLHCLTAAIFA